MNRILMEVHEYGGKLYGYVIDWLTVAQCEKRFDCNYHLRGKDAYYIVFSDDRSITRAEAIAFCKAHYEGAYRILSCDLSGLGVIE